MVQKRRRLTSSRQAEDEELQTISIWSLVHTAFTCNSEMSQILFRDTVLFFSARDFRREKEKTLLVLLPSNVQGLSHSVKHSVVHHRLLLFRTTNFQNHTFIHPLT